MSSIQHANNFKILIADDEPDIIEFVCYNLNKEGFDVRSVSNGLDAIKVAKEYDPHLILLDIMMPGMDGYAFAERLHRARPDVPVCLMSGQLGTAKERSQLSANVHCVLEKPVLEEELHRVLSPLLVQSSHNLP